MNPSNRYLVAEQSVVSQRQVCGKRLGVPSLNQHLDQINMKKYSSLSRVCGIKFILCSAMLIQLIPQSDAQILFREAFSFGAFSDVTVKQDLDTEATYINYSNFTVGATTYANPEAPGTQLGDNATRGILLCANTV